jgi:hypothetical protein
MIVFKGDYEMFHWSRIEIRKSIHKFKDVTEPMEYNKLLFGFEEGRRQLLTGIVQVSIDYNRETFRRTEHTDGR